MVHENAANRELFGVADDEEIVGKYNILKDDEILGTPSELVVQRVFEEGGSADFTMDCDFTQVKKLTSSRSERRVLRVYLLALRDETDEVSYVIVQYEDTTNQLYAQKALLESEHRYRELVEALSDWVWTVDARARFMYSNPVVERILGYRSEEVIGKSAFVFALPEDRERLTQAFEHRVREGGRIVGQTLRSLSKTGLSRYLEVNADPILDAEHNVIGYHGVARDITERAEAEEELIRSEQNFRAIFNYVPAAVFAYDRAGVVTQANAVSERMVGFPVEYLVGRSMYETFAKPEDRAKREAVIARVFSGETVESLQWEDRCADGSTVFVLSNTAPVFSAEGKVVMGLGIGLDITALKMAERKGQELEVHMREFYRRTILAATCGKLVICDREEIEKMVGLPLTSWNVADGECLSCLREEVARTARSAGMEESRIDDLVLCVGESTTNALKHAGGGLASLHRMPDALIYVMSDHGAGIDALALPEVALTRGYTTAISLGMGYKTMISIADTVFLATGPLGTTVAVKIGLHPSHETSALACFTGSW